MFEDKVIALMATLYEFRYGDSPLESNVRIQSFHYDDICRKFGLYEEDRNIKNIFIPKGKLVMHQSDFGKEYPEQIILFPNIIAATIHDSYGSRSPGGWCSRANEIIVRLINNLPTVGFDVSVLPEEYLNMALLT